VRLAKRRRVRPDDPVAVVTRFLDAANHHDADGLRACVHPEFESFQPLHPARNFRGAGQLISNWKAIFEAEPGFRLTLLRASTTGNTVWAEIHGAGASAEAAGIFIVGVEDGRIRWIRVYSDLVEPLPEEPVEEAPEPSKPAIDWDRDPIRLVPPRYATDDEVADEGGEGDEPEVAAEGNEQDVAAKGNEQEVAAATASDPAEAAAPSLRLVGADTVTAEPAPETAVEGGSVEVLVGDAAEVESDSTDEPPPPDPEADVKAALGEADVAAAAKAPADDAEEVVLGVPAAASEDEPAGAWWDTVAGLGGAAPDPSESEAQPARRRLGFLRRGGRGGGS
jgi:limonene-1,2-epoxide hydrolase